MRCGQFFRVVFAACVCTIISKKCHMFNITDSSNYLIQHIHIVDSLKHETRPRDREVREVLLHMLNSLKIQVLLFHPWYRYCHNLISHKRNSPHYPTHTLPSCHDQDYKGALPRLKKDNDVTLFRINYSFLYGQFFD